MNLSHHLARFLVIASLGHAAVFAGTATRSDPGVGGIGYYWTLNVGANDATSASHFVGAWGWEDSSLFGAGQTPLGWTHNSDWIALKLEVTTTVTFRLESKAGVSLNNPFDPTATAAANLVPGMTIYSGWDNDLAPQAFADANNSGEPTDNWHSYVNRGNIEWAEDTRYFTHLEPNGTSVVEVTMVVPAGEYSLAVGGRAISGDDPARQGYLVSVTTGAEVPEPSSVGLLLAGGLGLFARRRRSQRGN